MSEFELSEAERQLVRNAGEGRPTVFDAEGPPVRIRAAVLRSLVAGMPFFRDLGLHCVTDDVARVPAAIDLSHALIEGVLDLEGVTGTHGEVECPGLVLRRCSVEEQFGPPAYGEPAADLNLRHARLARVELHECGFRQVDISHAAIAGNFEIHGSADPGRAVACWLRAVGAKVGGSVVLRVGVFGLPRLPPSPGAIPEYAANFRDARVEGALRIDISSFDGGLRLPRSVAGDAWLLGVSAMAPGSDAVAGQRTQVGGVLGFIPFQRGEGDEHVVYCNFVGSIDLLGACVGDLFFRSVSLDCGGRLLAPADEQIALKCGSLQATGGVVIDQGAFAEGSSMCGVLSFVSSRLAGDFHLGLQGNDDRVAADLSAATIGGSCQVWAASDWRAEDGSPPQPGSSLMRSAVRLTGHVLQVGFGMELVGTFAEASLRGAQVGSALFLSQATFDTLDLRMSRIQGELQMPGAIYLSASFDSSFIGQGVDVAATRLCPLHKAQAGPVLLSMADCKISADLTITQLVLQDHGPLQHPHRPWLVPDRQSVVLRMAPSCFEGRVDIVEIHDWASSSAPVLVSSFLFWKERGLMFMLDGTSDPIHRTAAEMHLSLERADQAESYLRLFLSYIWQSEASFIVVDDLQATSWLRLPPDADMSQVPQAIVLSDEGGNWLAECTFVYEKAVYRSRLRVAKQGGMVEMVEDRELLKLEEIMLRNDGNLRTYHVSGPMEVARLCHGMAVEWQHVKGQEAIDLSRAARGCIRLQLARRVEPAAPASRTGALAGLVQALRSRLGKEAAGPASGSGRMLSLSLKDTCCGSIDDDDGRAWGPGIRADLLGFQYDGFDELSVAQPDAVAVTQDASDAFRSAKQAGDDEALAAGAGERLRQRLQHSVQWVRQRMLLWHQRSQRRPEGAAARLDWLNRVSVDALDRHIRPQPHEHLAAVYRRRGEYEASRTTLVDLEWKRPLRGGRLVRPVAHLLRRVYGWGFGFGLNGWRAFLTCFLYVWIGACFTLSMNTGRVSIYPAAWPGLPFVDEPILVTDSQPTSTVALAGQGARVPATPPAPPGSEENLACGDQIDPLVYALDAMLPIVDLHQEDKCEVSGDAGAIWRIGRALYAVFGALLVSAAILTWTGVLRRNIDG